MSINTENRKKIEKLYSIKTVSGSLDKKNNSMYEYVKKELSDFCDDIFADDIGNVIAVKRSGAENAEKIALIAAADEAGFVAADTKSEGKIRLHGIGNPFYARLCGREAFQIEKGKSIYRGVLLSDSSDTDKIGEDSFYLETEDKNRDISEGDFICADDPPVFFGDNGICLNGLSSKIFCLSLIDIAKCAGSFSFDVYYIFAAQHLLGARGEKCAAYTVGADIAIAFKLIPEGRTKTGAGPVIAFSDGRGRCSDYVTGGLKEAAEGIGISYQLCAETEKDEISMIAPFISEGTKTGIIGISASNKKVGTSKCDLRDLRGAAAAACAFLIFSDEKSEENR